MRDSAPISDRANQKGHNSRGLSVPSNGPYTLISYFGLSHAHREKTDWERRGRGVVW